jgi:hypothetical protein
MHNEEEDKLSVFARAFNTIIKTILKDKPDGALIIPLADCAGHMQFSVSVEKGKEFLTIILEKECDGNHKDKFH